MMPVFAHQIGEHFEACEGNGYRSLRLHGRENTSETQTSGIHPNTRIFGLEILVLELYSVALPAKLYAWGSSQKHHGQQHQVMNNLNVN